MNDDKANSKGSKTSNSVQTPKSLSYNDIKQALVGPEPYWEIPPLDPKAAATDPKIE